MSVPFSRSCLSLVALLSFCVACGDDTGGPPFLGTLNPSTGDGGAGNDWPADSGSVTQPPPSGSQDSGTTPPVGGGGPPGGGGGGGGGDQDAGPTDPDSGPGPVGGGGDCCPDGNCICRGEPPTELTSEAGPYKTAELRTNLGTVTYPTDAEPPYAAVALCGGFTNTGPEMRTWAPFYASHGIVTIIVTTGGADFPAIRADKLLAALELLKQENGKSDSPLYGKIDVNRLGTSGYSMGGGGTTIASTKTPTLKTSVGLAAWSPANSGVTVPTLLLCGKSDTVAACSQSEGAYRGITDPTPKMLVAIDGSTHFAWFGPTDAGRGISGKYALAFQKVYLEGDQRWKSLLLSKLSGSTQTTNIQ